jgi:hypothetical protein
MAALSWTRFDDNWFVKMEALGLDCTEIGYLTVLIQYCSRSNIYDGHLSAFKARSITEVPDPDAILAHLNDVGRVLWDGRACVVRYLDDHLPPPHLREENRKDAENSRKRRQRAHAKGDHTLCRDTCPGNVPAGQARDGGERRDGPGNVPPGHEAGPGTGQDGPGQEAPPTDNPWQQERSAAARNRRAKGATPERRERHSASVTGGRNPAAKVTDDQAREIARRYAAGGVSQQSLADEFGISQSGVSLIVKRAQREGNVA